MEYKGFPFHGQVAAFNAIPPTTNATGSSNLASDVVSLSKYDLVNFVIQFSTHVDADILTVYKSSDLTTNSTQPITFNYVYTTQSATNQFTTQYAATTSGITTNTVDNSMYMFSINREALSSQYPNVYFTLTDSTGHAVSAMGFLTGARYTRQPMPDALS